jgi:uncharacterized protein (DUF1697 family)
MDQFEIRPAQTSDSPKYPMASYIVLLRAVNVGGTGKLPMSELKAMCASSGFSKIQTYIASGNVVFESNMALKKIRTALGARLKSYAGKPVDFHIRTVEEMKAVLESNPFPGAAPNRTVAIFLDEAPPADALGGLRGQRDEEVGLGVREIYVHYGGGMADSRLKVPGAEGGTARNMNTVAKLVELASAL